MIAGERTIIFSNPDITQKWLSLHGTARRSVLREAIAFLYENYPAGYHFDLPVNLEELARVNNAVIQIRENLTSEGLLIPTRSGFTILISEEMELRKRRTAIAHELAHTLFYLKGNEQYSRMYPVTKAEEYFCFDTGRLLLAPEWLIEKYCQPYFGFPKRIFDILVDQFLLSKGLAARVLLADYSLAVGVAGRWQKTKLGWRMVQGKTYASPGHLLDREGRQNLHTIIRELLNEGIYPQNGVTVLRYDDSNGGDPFIIAVLKS